MVLAAAARITHVIVDNTPDPIARESLQVAWNTYHVTVVALVIAVLAAALAGCALVVAIDDARRNQEQLGLAKGQYDVVVAQLLEQLRKPTLSLVFDNHTPEGSDTFESYNIGDVGTKSSLLLPMRILNSGDRSVVAVDVEFLVPWYGNPQAIDQISVDVSKGLTARELHPIHTEGNYWRYTMHYDYPVMSHDSGELSVLVLDYPSIVQDYRIRWRLTTGENVFPEDGQYGTLWFRVVNPPSN